MGRFFKAWSKGHYVSCKSNLRVLGQHILLEHRYKSSYT